MVQPVSWLEQLAARQGARYEPDADARWMNSWEPFATLRVSDRYEHSLSRTDAQCSRTMARCVVQTAAGPFATWLIIAQDERLLGHAAATSDAYSPFLEPHVALTRRHTGHAAFDHHFAAYADDDGQLQKALGPSVQKLLLSWRIPVHVEIRPGGAILAPVELPSDPASLEWLWQMPLILAEKAAKHRS